MAVSGDTVVVGARDEDSSSTGVNSTPNESADGSGAAYVFTRSGTTWSQQAYLKASNPGVTDYFGYSVSVSGDTVVVGAVTEDSSTTGVNNTSDEAAADSGAAYIFTGLGPPPTVASISPSLGSISGGTSVTITGTGFTGATSVTIGGVAATNVVVINDTTITCTTPAGTAGTASVLVTTPVGTNGANTLFTYTNSAPTALALSENIIAENVAANSTVGTLSTTDPDAGSTFTYTLVSGSGSTDNAAFNISGSSLRITASPDFETKSSYAVRVRTTDQGGLFFEQEFTITITDGNDAPTFAGYSISTPYQTAAAISFGKLLTKATDLEGHALTVSAAGPASTQGGTAVLQSGSILYTPANGFSGTDTFTVTITDALGASVVGSVTVNVQINTGIGTNAPVLTAMSGGRMGIGFQGIPGRSYQIQRSTNMSDWTPLTTVTAAANGTVTYIDESPPPGSAFYRLRKP